MKKILSLILALMLLLLCLASCDSSKHEHITEDWKYNEYGHWQPITCSLNTCNLEESPISDHVDDNTDNICDICGYKKMLSTEQPTDSNTECVHTYGEWQYDETYHWCDWSCSLDLCDIDTTGEHIDKDGDSVCDTCNYIILNCVHTYGEWQYNETHHWRDWSCSLNMCRIETTGEHFDEDENGVCDKCGYFPPINSDVMGFNLQKIVFDSLENTKRTPTKDTDVIDGINSTIKMGSNAYDAIEFCFYYNGNVSEELFEDMHYSNIVQANEPTRMIVRVKYNNINIEALKTLSQSSQIISIHISAASELGVEPEPDVPIDSNNGNKKLVDLDKYSAMTANGTTSIEVVYDYIEGEFTTYEFVIEDQETIVNIMTEIFKLELEDYPDDQDMDIYQRWIIVKQGNNRYHIDLTLVSDGEKMYICQSQGVRDIIETYIDDNLNGDE